MEILLQEVDEVDSVINGFGLAGIDGYLVEIENKTIYGQPSISIIGLGDRAIKEASERIHSAIISSGYEFPKKKIVINLAPVDIKKKGSHFDIGMAIGLLLQSGQIEVKKEGLLKTGFFGALSLNGKIQPCDGVLPIVIAAKEVGMESMIVPQKNAREASIVTGINVYGFNHLKEIISFLEEESDREPIVFDPTLLPKPDYGVDFSEVKGQRVLIEYLLFAVAGGHNLLMVGPPGCGKSMIAKRIPSILPEMSFEEAIEVTKIYSVSGDLKKNGGLIIERPFRSPHHSASLAAIIGGTQSAKPGEITLAHNGVLFFDELTEFQSKAIEALRQPMEDGQVTISRANIKNTCPANFMFIASMNPCSCGFYGSGECICKHHELIKYNKRVSGPIFDRIDIQKYMHPVQYSDFVDESTDNSSKSLREKVKRARRIQQERFKDIDGIYCNAQMSNRLIQKYCQIDSQSRSLMEAAQNRYHFSGRSHHIFLKVARTIADLDDSKEIKKEHITKALLSRDWEKKFNRRGL